MVMRIGFTTDGWSSSACAKYNSITVHYINNNYQIRKFLKRLNNTTNTSSAEHKPSVHEIILEVFNLHKIFSDSTTKENSKGVKNYCAGVLSKLEGKFKNHGCDEKALAEANFLDPHYRCVALRRFSPTSYEKVKREIIIEHSSYEEWASATHREVSEEVSREGDPLYEACRDDEKATNPMVGAEEKPPILMEWGPFQKSSCQKTLMSFAGGNKMNFDFHICLKLLVLCSSF